MDHCRNAAHNYFIGNNFNEAAIHFRKQAAQASNVYSGDFQATQEITNHEALRTIGFRLCAIRFEILMGSYDGTSNALTQLYLQYRSLFMETSWFRGIWYFLRGSANFYKGKSSETLIDSQKAINILSKLSQQDSKYCTEYILALLLKAKALWRQRKLSDAIYTLSLAIKTVSTQHNNKLNYLLGKAISLLGTILLDMNRYAMGKDFLNLSLQIYQKHCPGFNPDHIYKGMIHSDLALAHLKLNDEHTNEADIKRAEQHNRMAKRIFNGVYGKSPHRYQAAVISREARIYRARNIDRLKEKEVEDKLRSLFTKELKIRQQAFNVSKHYTYARIYNAQASLHLKTQNYEEAIQQATYALAMVSKLDIVKNQDQHTITSAAMTLEDSPAQQLRALHYLGLGYLHRADQRQGTAQLNDLSQLQNIVEVGLAHIKNLSGRFPSEETRTILLIQSRPLEELAVKLLCKLYKLGRKHQPQQPEDDFPTLYADQLYRQVQYLKSYLLTINDQIPVDWPSIPNSAIPQNKKTLKGILDDLLNGVTAFFDDGATASAVQHIKTIHQLLDQHLNRSKNLPPPPYTFSETLQQSQDGLDKNDGAGILSYYLCRDKLVALLITESDFKVYELVNSAKAVKQLKIHLKKLHQHIATELDIAHTHDRIRNQLYDQAKTRKDFITLSRYVYRQVLEKINNSEGIADLRRLYIMPDQELWLCPIEALLTHDVDESCPYKKMPYFIQQDIITSYHFSIHVASLAYNRQHCNTPSRSQHTINSVLFTYGEADTPEERHDGIQQKIEDWKAIFNDHIELLQDNKFLQPSSNVGQAFKMSNIYEMMVLIAHGNHDKDFLPRIKLDKEFWIDRTFIEQLPKLNFKLLVLCTCFSGAGALRGGEGMFSFCRTFFQRNVHNIIYSLYRIKHESTYGILGRFFSLILTEDKTTFSKMHFAKALHIAKKEAIQKSTVGPFLWAGMLFIGDQTSNMDSV